MEELRRELLAGVDRALSYKRFLTSRGVQLLRAQRLVYEQDDDAVRAVQSRLYAGCLPGDLPAEASD